MSNDIPSVLKAQLQIAYDMCNEEDRSDGYMFQALEDTVQASINDGFISCRDKQSLVWTFLRGLEDEK